MVKKRATRARKRTVVTDLPESRPASVLLVHADDTEIIPEKEATRGPQSEDSEAGNEAGPSSRPVRLYADGK